MSSLNTRNPLLLEAIHAPAITLLHHLSQMMLYALSCSKPSPYFFSSHRSGTQVDLNFIRPKNVFSEVVWLFLGVFWQSLIWPCLYYVVNTLYLLLWSLLLIVDFHSDTSTSWRVFFSWLDFMKGVFFTMERILRSYINVVLCGRPGLFMLLSSTLRSFFPRMYQTVDLATPNVPAIYLMDLFWFWSLIIVCFTCMERSFDRMMWVQSIGFQI